VKIFFAFYMKNIINDFKSSFFLQVLYSRRIKFKTKTCFRSISILSSQTSLFLSNFLFVSGTVLKTCALVLSTSCVPPDRQFHPRCDQMQSVTHFLIITPCYWSIGYRRFVINLHTHHHEAIYSLMFVPLDMRLPGGLETSSTNYQVPQRSEGQ